MINTKAIGFIFANMHDESGGDMTKSRSLASIPFGGRYRLIDFPLSGLTACGIQQVVVVTKENYRSLMDHLGSGRAWDLSRKNQGLIISPPFAAESGVYHGKVEALLGALSYVERSRAEHVVFTDCNWIADIDMTRLLDEHMKSGADATLACTKYEATPRISKKSVVVQNEGDRVTDVLVSPIISENRTELLSMGIFIFKREKLISLLENAAGRAALNFERDLLAANLASLDVRCYEHTGIAMLIHDPHSYYLANMALLEPGVTDALFSGPFPILTKVRDEAPVRYGPKSVISRSLVADGCIIEGTVENSVLFRGVHVAKGAHIKNSIIMQSTVIAENAKLSYVITDKNVRVGDGLSVMGAPSYPLYVEKGKILE